MKISVITLFPQMFEGPFAHSIVKKAIDKKLIAINFVNLRDFGIGKHKVVDDKPYGGGIGMVLRVDVLKSAIDNTIDPKIPAKKQKVILLEPKGKSFNQAKAEEYSKLKHLILICGHYEGFDGRIKKFVDEEISVGNFILTGGEIAAMGIIDATARLIKGVLKIEAVTDESFSNNQKLLEYPQFTRPEKFGKFQVPKILLSGNHKKISDWKKGKTKKVKSSDQTL